MPELDARPAWEGPDVAGFVVFAAERWVKVLRAVYQVAQVGEGAPENDGLVVPVIDGVLLKSESVHQQAIRLTGASGAAVQDLKVHRRKQH